MMFKQPHRDAADAGCPGAGGLGRRRPGGRLRLLALVAIVSWPGAACQDSEQQGPAFGADAACTCLADQHCVEGGVCVDDVCVEGEAHCESSRYLQVCADDGSGFLRRECPAGTGCALGQCLPEPCEPKDTAGCLDGLRVVCDDAGTEWITRRCPEGQSCVHERCEPIRANVLLIVDTSSSMNWTPDNANMERCVGDHCASWDYPGCDDSQAPQTRLGLVKLALARLLDSPEADGIRFALQRFPQEISSAQPPDCHGGYWFGTARLEGDEDRHAVPRDWLQEHLAEIVVAPFAADADTSRATMRSWVDFVEELGPTDQPCNHDHECENSPCLDGHCAVYRNPELLGKGASPLGRSLFYAGEYFRNFVLVEGQPCETSSDCASANYACRAGRCHDPHGFCRPNIVVVLTDGAETEHTHTDDFFHPRVQAKRLRYGLGCHDDDDCGAGALCVEGVCRPPVSRVDEQQMVCDTDDVPCASDSQCVRERCRPARIDYVDPEGANRLTDAAGLPTSLTIHVIDTSNVPGANTLIAAYGGGRHFSVDLAEPDVLATTFQTLFGGTKQIRACRGD